MTKLIVHPGTGTIIDANDGTLIVDVVDASVWDDDEDAVLYAERHGSPVIPEEQWAVAVGEMFDGINFFGPFASFEDAALWADCNVSANWWVVRLESPSA
jgi:hypothetical protein